MTKICQCPYKVEMDESAVDEVRQGEVNVVCMIVDTYKQALKETQLVFEKTKTKLVESQGQKVALGYKINSLLVTYQNALMTIKELRKALLSSQGKNGNQSARILTLLDTISQTNAN